MRPYLAIVRLPHAARLMAATAVYGISATGALLPLVFFARDATGSFGGASAVLAASAIGGAVVWRRPLAESVSPQPAS